MTGEFLLKGDSRTIAKLAVSEAERKARDNSSLEAESYWHFVDLIIGGTFGSLDIDGPGGMDMRLTGASFLRDHLGADDNVLDINREENGFRVVVGKRLRSFFEEKFDVIIDNDQPYAEIIKDQYAMIDAIGGALQLVAMKKRDRMAVAFKD